MGCAPAARREDRRDVVLVVPPFASATFPALGASLLAAGCRARGVDAVVLYANLELAARVGLESYQGVYRSRVVRLLGEAVFRDAAFGNDTSRGGRPSRGGAPDDDADRERARRCEAEVEPFLDHVVGEILAREPRVVGFSSVFQQNMASIALARRLKRRRGGVVTVLGGANAARPMGAALAAVTDAFDHVVSGEADVLFPRLCERLLAGERPGERLIDGGPVRDLDAVPIPDYDDYFAQLARHVEAGRLPPELPVCLHFESSRGCWWGERSHCTFCGLNGLEMGYRSKTPDRLLRELDLLAERYRVGELSAADNIMPRSFRDRVLPALAARRGGQRFFYEVKANLGPKDLDAFVAAGVHHIQPGIESLSSHVLRRLGKGVRATQNLALLRDCGSRAIRVAWNLLVGVPGESAADYRATLDLLPAIEHLQPPIGVSPVRLDRFSPYVSHPQRHGIAELEPVAPYRSLYPAGAELSELAYYFRGRYTTPYLEDRALQRRLEGAVARWKRLWDGEELPPKLAAVPLETGSWYVEDTRSCAREPVCLAPPEWARLLLRLERPVAPDRLSGDAKTVLGELAARGFVVEHEGKVLSLVTRPMLGLELHRAFADGQETTGAHPCCPRMATDRARETGWAPGRHSGSRTPAAEHPSG